MKTRNPAATCKTCPYFDTGRCQKSPPVVIISPTPWEGGITYTSSEHPVKMGDSWCGEHPDFFAATTTPAEPETVTLAMVREAWGCPEISMTNAGQKWSVGWFGDSVSEFRRGLEYKIRTFPYFATEAEALRAAYNAAPKRAEGSA